MRRSLSIIAFLLLFTAWIAAASKPKPHVVGLGQWQAVKWHNGDEAATLKMRPLVVDGKIKEYTTGDLHEVTDRTFVVRRVFRLNDALPGDASRSKWQWHLGGWLHVNRASGRVSELSLPEFDSASSEAVWYQDYAAYCGVAENGEKLHAVVAQVGRRTAVLKAPLLMADGSQAGISQCEAPKWQREPARVTFQLKSGEKLTFSVHGRTAEALPEPVGDDQ